MAASSSWEAVTPTSLALAGLNVKYFFYHWTDVSERGKRLGIKIICFLSSIFNLPRRPESTDFLAKTGTFMRWLSWAPCSVWSSSFDKPSSNSKKSVNGNDEFNAPRKRDGKERKKDGSKREKKRNNSRTRLMPAVRGTTRYNEYFVFVQTQD